MTGPMEKHIPGNEPGQTDAQYAEGELAATEADFIRKIPEYREKIAELKNSNNTTKKESIEKIKQAEHWLRYMERVLADIQADERRDKMQLIKPGNAPEPESEMSPAERETYLSQIQ